MQADLQAEADRLGITLEEYLRRAEAGTLDDERAQDVWTMTQPLLT